MKFSHVVTTLLMAGAVAFVLHLSFNPRVTEQAAAPQTNQATPEDPVNVAALAVDTEPETSFRRRATISARPDGHYWTRALVNRKASVEFMVDTGASVVALSYKDAQKMGLRPDRLEYKWEIRTAGGRTMGASVQIEEIQIGQVKVRNVDAMVLRTDLEQSLLGMSFLRELYSYEFRGNRMIIQQ